MKEKLKKVYNAIVRIKPRTYVSIAMVVFSVVNMISMNLNGESIFNFGENDVEYFVNIILNLITILFPFWFNNSFSELAQCCDSLLFYLRDGKISKEELEQFIEEHKTNEVPTE